MTWGNKTNYNTTYLQNGSDSPADARPELLNAVNELTNVIDGLNTAGGAAKLDSSTTKVIANSGVQTTNTDLILSPGGSGTTVNIENVLNLKPQTVAELTAISGSEGDVAYCSNGDAGSKCLAVYNGTAWKVVTITSDTISA